MRKVPPGIQIILSICEEPSPTVASGWNVVEGKSAVISSIAFQWIDRNTIWPATLGGSRVTFYWTVVQHPAAGPYRYQGVDTMGSPVTGFTKKRPGRFMTASKVHGAGIENNQLTGPDEI